MFHLPSWSRSRLLLISGLVLLVGGLSLIATHSLQARNHWLWRSLTAQLPSSLQSSFTLSAGRGSDWLASTGERLFTVRDSEVTEISDRIQANGRVSAMGTDQQRYLLALTNTYQTQPTLRLTDGQTWEDVPSSSAYLHQTVDRISGSNGTWAIQSSDANTSYTPGSWELMRWQQGQSATYLAPPEGASRFNAGCFPYPDRTTGCTGVTAAGFINDQLFLFGGRTEMRDSSDRTYQTASANAWRWTGDRFVAIEAFPSTKFISGIWQGQNQILIATSHAVTNPFAADDLWLFDGTRFTSLHDDALRSGLLSMDAREIRAAQSNERWLILAGKNALRLEANSLTLEGTTRDLYQTLAGSRNGLFLTGGATSSFDQSFVSQPMRSALATVSDTGSTAYGSEDLFRESTVSGGSNTRPSDISISTSPASSEIADGNWFTYTATASDPDGVRSMEIFVQGVSVKRCADYERTCSYTQQYWRNSQDRRVIPIFTRVTDYSGNITENPPFLLTIPAVVNPPVIPPYVPPYTPPVVTPPLTDSGTLYGALPTGLVWQNHAFAKEFTYANWTRVPGNLPWNTHSALTFGVVGRESLRGVNKIVLWVNGTPVKTCILNKNAQAKNAIVSCSVDLLGADYPAGAEVFMNAQFVRNWIVERYKGKTRSYPATPADFWTEGVRVTRPAQDIQPVLPVYPGSSSGWSPYRSRWHSIPTPSAPAPQQPSINTQYTLDYTNRQIKLTANGWSSNTSRIELWLNNSLVQTCYDTNACSVIAYPTPQTRQTYQAALVTTDGQRIWSEVKGFDAP